MEVVSQVGIDVNENGNTQGLRIGNLDGRKVCTHFFKYLAYISFTVTIVSGSMWYLHLNESYSRTIFYSSLFVGGASLSYYFADYFTNLYCRELNS